MRNKLVQGVRTPAPLLLLALVAMQVLQAQTFTVLYTFTGGTDGGKPMATPILYNGSVLGTASAGGQYDKGTVYGLNFQSRNLTVLHSFVGGAVDGAQPLASLIQAGEGDLYGTTYKGGRRNYGTVFKLTLQGQLTLLHSFLGPPQEGYGPSGALVFDPFGNVYGTTYLGGKTMGWGTVFEITSGGVYKTGQSFSPNGALPRAGLHYVNGMLFGTTSGGADRSYGGTVFQVGVTPPLHTFTGGADGAYPMGKLISDPQGTILYGTASAGGSASFGVGNGVVFKLDVATGQETVLHTFTGPDGSTPKAGLTQDADGNLYGTTFYGGTYGYGTVFKLDTSGNLTTVYSFTGGADGANPYGGVLVDAAGNIWGATSAGGSAHGPGGYGTLFLIGVPVG